MHKLTNEEIDRLPLACFARRIVIVETAADAVAAAEAMRREKMLGFDTETRPSFTRGVSYGVALLQLSTEDVAWLVRINKVGLPQEIVDVLADPQIIKAGVAIRDDIRALQKKRNFVPAGFIDLQTMAKAQGFEDFSLKKLAAHVMGVRISKRQRLSNWEAPQLTISQQHYASTDAWVSLLIYMGMMRGEYEHERIRAIIAESEQSQGSEPQTEQK